MSNATPTSREAVLARIQASSKEEVILEEMQRQGFWSADAAAPEQAKLTELMQQEHTLLRELSALNEQLRLASDPEAALQAMRKQRMADAKARREETRQRAAQRRHQKALAWHALSGREIFYLGEGVSQGLADGRLDADRLIAKGLPVLEGPLALATAMDIPLPELRFLAFQRSVSRISHYRRFGLPKKTGGLRLISAPMPRLKRAQYWVLDNILAKLPVSEAAHGFVPGRSIVSNAAPHVGQAVVVNFDLKDFFPSIRYQRVRGLFQSFGYSRQLATVLGLLTTELPTEAVEIDGMCFQVQSGERHLPQGAPSSPAITNLLCRRLDRRLSALAQRLGFRYSRYADDMTFSADAAGAANLPRLLWQAKRVIADEGFVLHPDKQRVMRASSRQEVTGVVVNHHATVCRATLRRFRATLHQVEKDGPPGKSWHGNPDVLNALAGYARFVRMVDPAKGDLMCRQVALLQARWGGAPARTHGDYFRRFRAASAAGQALPGKIQLAKPKAAPQLEKTAIQLQKAKETVASAATLTVDPTLDAASQPAVPPPQVAQAEAPAANPHEAMPASLYVNLAVQFVLMLVGGMLSGNLLLLFGSAGWAWYAMNSRKASWWVWLGVVVVCRLLWRMR
ncbi:reverse transcriptase domain-containing protein [Parachitinimonas caeni]|uniref:RNA-directed DNA polymerase n=1 Tax=Parachitinimonas caeni TaxID=3031301 RepID=A0ABT7DYE3_9NEIS|nr:reverse transcriptase domain-containing protein [Parachitinimonas caeni]MDK2125092.1 reverse transcriptase domain-containing protein [Parachitinimonas caeni]